MRLALLAVSASAAALAAPAPAQTSFIGQAFSAGSGNSGVSVHHGRDRRDACDVRGGRDHRGDRDGRGRRGGRDGFCGDIGLWVNGGEWALYNNRSWESDSYNDWWHDQPHRSFPRWVSNGTCDRMWWSGGGWRC